MEEGVVIFDATALRIAVTDAFLLIADINYLLKRFAVLTGLFVDSGGGGEELLLVRPGDRRGGLGRVRTSC